VGKSANGEEKMRYLAIPFTIFCLAILSFFPTAYAQFQVGEKVPGFITSTLDGKRIVLKEYWEQKGNKALILSFFATWCKPCKEDLKYLQKVRDQHGPLGVQVLCVLTQDSSKEEVVRKFMEELGIKLPVLLDEHGIIGKRYGVTGLPCNFVIGKEGFLRAKYLGYSEAVRRDFEGRLRELLSIP
jgi:cytochrome c biogenesis protein CcmG/thiol:disulfide interchange protein DsbE